MAKVFLSYSTEDRDVADRVHEWLVGQGHEVFFDRDLVYGVTVGEAWKTRLYDELSQVDAVVGLISRAYVASTWCTAEVSIADARGCLVIPMRIADITHPLIQDRQHTSADRTVALEQVGTRLRWLDLGTRGEWRDGDNPYPGLKSFTADRSRLFFGRSREVREVVALLRAEVGHDLTAVTGPSGCGKSSLVLAGVVPQLAADPDWLVLDTVEPGTDPVYALVVALAATARRSGLAWSPENVRRRLAGADVRELVDELRIASRARHVLLVVDQLEALFSPTVPADELAAFGELLAGLSGRARVLGTVRSEFLDDLAGLGVGRIGTYLLGPLAKDMLRAAIREPARIAGLPLEPELAGRLIADTGSTDALPLLAFALNLLAEGKRRGDTLTVAAYDALADRHGFAGLGGLHAVLASQASGALTVAARDLGEPAVLAGLVRLVSVDRSDRWTRRPVDVATLDPSLREAMAVFVSHRLLVADGAVVQFAHEALFTEWPPLAAAIKRQGTALRAARDVEQAAAEWSAARRSEGYLWDEERYSATVRLLSPSAGPDASGREFLRATDARVEGRRRRERFRRTRTLSILSALLAVAVVAGVVAAVQTGRAQDERDAATKGGLVDRAAGVRAADPQQALRLALAAHHIAPDRATETALTRNLTQDRYAATLRGHTSSVFSAAFSPDQRVLATGDGADHALRLWDVSDLSHPRSLGEPLTEHTEWVLAAAFSPNGYILATASQKELLLWNVEDLERPHLIVKVGAFEGEGRADKLGLAFSPDGTKLAATYGGLLSLWDVSDPNKIVQLGPVAQELLNTYSDVAFSPDGLQLAVVLQPDGGWNLPSELWLWDVTDVAVPRRIRAATAEDSFTAVFYVPGRNRMLATSTGDYLSSADPEVRLWDTSTPEAIVQVGDPLRGHDVGIRDITISPDGRTLASAGLDTTVALWDIGNPLAPRSIANPLTDHTNEVHVVAFGADGALVTGSADNRAILWWPSSHVQPVRLDGRSLDVDKEVLDVALSDDGHRLAVAAHSGRTWVWDLTDPTTPRGPGSVVAEQGRITSLAFRPDGRFLATGTEDSGKEVDEQVTLWSVEEVYTPRRAGPPLPGLRDDIANLRFSRSGRQLWATSVDVTLRTWDVDDPAAPVVIADSMQGRSDNQRAIAFRADGAAIASQDSKDRDLVVIRDITDPRDVVLLEQPIRHDEVRALTFVAEGEVLATGGDDVVLWDVSTAWQPRQLGSPLGVGSDVDSLATSEDGTILAIGKGDGSLSVWDITDRGRPHRIGDALERHDTSVQHVALSHDGRRLVSGDAAGHVALWDLSAYLDVRGRPTELACERAGRGFNREEWLRYVGTAFEYRDTCP
ncbi:nSTAND1 domain-containing NTPase [Saccharothrix stipae]